MIISKPVLVGIMTALGASVFLCLPVGATGALTLSPLRTELVLAHGKTAKGQLNISNETDAPMSVRLEAESFRVVDSNYHYEFNSGSDVAKWVVFKDVILELPAHKSEQVPYTINVPTDAEPGGYYISMFAGTTAFDVNDAIKARQRIGSLFYITVPGVASPKGALVSLDLPVIINNSSKLTMYVKNESKVHFRSNYTTTFYGLIRKDAVSEVKSSALIMPGSVRHISETLPAPGFPGVYRVVVTISLGDNPSRQETRLLIFMPMWALVTGGIIAMLIVMMALRHK